MIPTSVMAGEVMVGSIPVGLAARVSGCPTAFANPKSSTFTVPSGLTLMFAGFKSRWMMP